MRFLPPRRPKREVKVTRPRPKALSRLAFSSSAPVYGSWLAVTVLLGAGICLPVSVVCFGLAGVVGFSGVDGVSGVVGSSGVEGVVFLAYGTGVSAVVSAGVTFGTSVVQPGTSGVSSFGRTLVGSVGSFL